MVPVHFTVVSTMRFVWHHLFIRDPNQPRLTTQAEVVNNTIKTIKHWFRKWTQKTRPIKSHQTTSRKQYKICCCPHMDHFSPKNHTKKDTKINSSCLLYSWQNQSSWRKEPWIKHCGAADPKIVWLEPGVNWQVLNNLHSRQKVLYVKPSTCCLFFHDVTCHFLVFEVTHALTITGLLPGFTLYHFHVMRVFQ